MTVIMLGASMAPGYDVPGGAISDLGTIPETRLLFNASLLLVGVLNIVGGWLCYRWHRRVGLLALFVIAGVGAIGAGLFPLDSGGLHGLFALVAFLAFNLEALATAPVVHGPMRALSVLAGAIGFVFVVLMVIGDGGQHGRVRADRSWRHGADDRVPGDALDARVRRLAHGRVGRAARPLVVRGAGRSYAARQVKVSTRWRV